MNKLFSHKSIFRNTTCFEKRQNESKKILDRYPERIPIICERSQQHNDIPELDRKKYLVPNDFTIGQFLFIIRKRMRLSQEKAIFIFINNSLYPSNELLSKVYQTQKNEDGFLYISYSGETTFGSV